MVRYTRQEVLRESGARPSELADLEKRGLIVPNRSRKLLGRFTRSEEYYTDGQLQVLRLIVKTRRKLEASRLSY